MLTSSVESTQFMPFEGSMNIPASLRAPSILCVGNDSTLLHTRRLLLGNNGYRVTACSATDLPAFRLPLDLDGVLICHSVKGEQLDQVLAWLEPRLPREKILLTKAMYTPQRSSEGYRIVASESPQRLLEFLGKTMMPPA